MINFPGLIHFLLKASFLTNGLVEGPVQEIKLINFTDWGWLLFISAVILVVWTLLIFQAKSPGSHEYGSFSELETNNEFGDHNVGDPEPEITNPNG